MSEIVPDERFSPEDEALLAWLGRVAAVADPEPGHLLELGRAAFSVRRIDAELAELVSDSVLLAGLVRSGRTGPRLLSFSAGDLVVEIQVTDAPSGGEVLGLVEGLMSAHPARVDVEDGAGRVEEHSLDGFGRFRLDRVPSGLVRFRVVAGPLDVTTAWVRLDTGFRHPTP